MTIESRLGLKYSWRHPRRLVYVSSQSSPEGRILKGRFTDDQIIPVLHEWYAGAKVVDLVGKHGVNEQTLYRWKKEHRHAGERGRVSESTRGGELAA